MKTIHLYVYKGGICTPLEHPINIFSLQIQQRENEVALAKLQVPTYAQFWRIGKQYALCEVDEKGSTVPLFVGRLLQFPLQIQSDLTEIELTAVADDYQEQLEELVKQQNSFGVCDPLFFEEADKNPVNVLEAQPAFFYWDRISQRVTLSDIFEGRQCLDLSDAILADTFSMRLGELPYDEIRVKVSAEWEQRAAGEFDLFPLLARKFSNGMINTLTPRILQNAWPQKGDRLSKTLPFKNTGYRVVSSALREVTPPTTGTLDIYPTITPLVSDLVDGKCLEKRLRRHWFKGHLNIAYNYVQPRREIAVFNLRNYHQLNKNMSANRVKSLTFRLQSLSGIIAPSAGTFFSTARGKKAIDYAIARAWTQLAASTRCVEVNFCIPFDTGQTLSLDHTVVLKLPFLPGGAIRGKVSYYRLIKTATESYCYVRLAASIARNKTDDESAPEGTYHKSSIGAQYTDFSEQVPEKGHPDISSYALHDFIKDIQVKGDGAAQTHRLITKSLEQSIEEVLQEIPTEINIPLTDLRMETIAEHTIQFKVFHVPSIAYQISLTE